MCYFCKLEHRAHYKAKNQDTHVHARARAHITRARTRTPACTRSHTTHGRTHARMHARTHAHTHTHTHTHTSTHTHAHTHTHTHAYIQCGIKHFSALLGRTVLTVHGHGHQTSVVKCLKIVRKFIPSTHLFPATPTDWLTLYMYIFRPNWHGSDTVFGWTTSPLHKQFP